MDITVKTVEHATVAEIVGELDASTVPLAQQQVSPLAVSGSKLILDMTGVPYMSSAGLRMLLSTYRQVSASGGQIVLVGVTNEIKDTMSATGFLKFFVLRDTVAAALDALNEGIPAG